MKVSGFEFRAAFAHAHSCAHVHSHAHAQEQGLDLVHLLGPGVLARVDGQQVAVGYKRRGEAHVLLSVAGFSLGLGSRLWGLV